MSAIINLFLRLLGPLKWLVGLIPLGSLLSFVPGFAVLSEALKAVFAFFRRYPWALFVVVAVLVGFRLYVVGTQHGYERGLAEGEAKVAELQEQIKEAKRQADETIDKAIDDANNIAPTPDADSERLQLCKSDPTCRSRRR